MKKVLLRKIILIVLAAVIGIASVFIERTTVSADETTGETECGYRVEFNSCCSVYLYDDGTVGYRIGNDIVDYYSARQSLFDDGYSTGYLNEQMKYGVPKEPLGYIGGQPYYLECEKEFYDEKFNEAAAEYISLGYKYAGSMEQLESLITEQADNCIEEMTYYLPKNLFEEFHNDRINVKYSNIFTENAIRGQSISGGYDNNYVGTVTVNFVTGCTGEELQAAVTEVNRIVAAYNYGSTYDKIKNVHDYLCNTISYDYSYQEYTIYSALIKHTSVCEGYADSFKAIMDAMGIPCETVSGYKNGSGPHKWNNVMIDGQWYHIDCTWDDQETYISRNSFLLGQDRMRDSRLAPQGYLTESTPVTQDMTENNDFDLSELYEEQISDEETEIEPVTEETTEEMTEEEAEETTTVEETTSLKETESETEGQAETELETESEIVVVNERQDRHGKGIIISVIAATVLAGGAGTAIMIHRKKTDGE